MSNIQNYYKKKYLKYKTKYLQLAGFFTKEELFSSNIDKNSQEYIDTQKWLYRKSTELFFENKKCKIFFTFDGRPDEEDFNIKFKSLSQQEKKFLMENILFNPNTTKFEAILERVDNQYDAYRKDYDPLEFKWYECSTNNNIIFYNSIRLTKFIEALKTNGVNKTAQDLLELACVWNHEKTEEDNLLLDICFGNTTICKTDIENSRYDTRLLNMDDPIWGRHQSIKDSYDIFLRQILF
jgi:hypothetical protein